MVFYFLQIKITATLSVYIFPYKWGPASHHKPHSIFLSNVCPQLLSLMSVNLINKWLQVKVIYFWIWNSLCRRELNQISHLPWLVKKPGRATAYEPTLCYKDLDIVGFFCFLGLFFTSSFSSVSCIRLCLIQNFSHTISHAPLPIGCQTAG